MKIYDDGDESQIKEDWIHPKKILEEYPFMCKISLLLSIETGTQVLRSAMNCSFLLLHQFMITLSSLRVLIRAIVDAIGSVHWWCYDPAHLISIQFVALSLIS